VTRQLDETTEEKDLGIYVTHDLKVSLQCAKAASKAALILRMIKRNFHRIDVEDFRILYKTYRICYPGMVATHGKGHPDS